MNSRGHRINYKAYCPSGMIHFEIAFHHANRNKMFLMYSLEVSESQM